MRRILPPGLLVGSLSLLFASYGCGGGELDTTPLASTGTAGASQGTGGAAGTGGASGGTGGTAGATAGSAGMSGAAGTGGAAKADRADPSTFPKDCVGTCEQACEKLDACGAATSTKYAIKKEECQARCKLAESGPVWDDISQNFKCCASQAACDDVAICGSWLKLPTTSASCKKLCSCFFGGASTAAQAAGLTPPDGYSFANDAMVVEPLGAEPLGDMSLPASVSSRPFGKGVLLTALRPMDDDQAAALAARVRTIPTFRDGVGRIATAPGGIILSFSHPTALGRATKVLSAHGLPAPKKLGFGKQLYVARGNDGWAALAAMGKLAKESGVVAELDLVREYKMRFTPNDPKFPDQWHLQNTGQKNAAIPGVDGRVSEAWDVTQGSAQVVISINDDGTDLDHPDLKENLVGKAINFPDDWQARRDKGQFGQHGTSCTGVAAARGNNGEGVSGVCPQCKILPSLLGDTVNGGFQVSDTEEAQRFVDIVDAGAWVISNSWGPSTGDAQFKDTSFYPPKLSMAVKAAFDHAETQGRGGKGTVILFAAGNDNSPLDAASSYPTNLAVGAVDDQGLKAYYSNSGKLMGISAPSNGGDLGITTTRASVNGAGNLYTDQFGGTSSACPFAAGVVGLIFSANPSLTAAQARDILQKSARKIDPLYGDWDPTTGFSPHYGAGLVNAYTAVKMAKGECQKPEDCQPPSDLAAGKNKPACSPCRSPNECQDGVCQALPDLGGTFCVGKATAGTCPTGTKLVFGYCVPDRKTCGLCKDSDTTCNGQDDDCNGKVDDGASCGGGGRCPAGENDCASGKVCAAISCVQACSTAADCGEDIDCKPVKDRYGAASSSVKGCAQNSVGGCKSGCEVLAASLPTDKAQEFVDCMMNGAAECSVVMTCAGKLPVKF